MPFTQLGLHRIEINVRPENDASCRVAEKAGYEFEGFKKAFLHIDGAWRDHKCFVKTNELNFNKNVNDFLKEFGEFFNVDRAYIFTSEDNLKTVSNEFEWCANGIDAEMQNLLNVPMKEFKFLKTNLF